MREWLRSVWREPRSPDPPARLRRDWALLAAIVVATLLEGLLRTDLASPAYGIALGLGLAPTVLWRRTRPLLMVATAFVTCAVVPLFVGHQPEAASLSWLLVLPYALFRWGSGREAVIGAALILAKIAVSAPLSDLVLGYVAMVAVFGLATTARYRARLWLRGIDEAKLLERERIARDLHDTVAHHVSAMAIRAQAGIAVSRRHPEAAVDALRVIEAEATRALAEMRTMVHALRRVQPAGLAPNPGLADVATLAGGSPVVEVSLSGDLADVPATVGTAVYRLAQESVTNARRHARGATRIEVSVVAEEGEVRLRVSDDGEAGPAGGAPGFGLVGMSERAGLLGGVCEAGPGPGRGWTVTAALPRTGAVA
ncbi:sensor histidine kinase [Actinoplanes solisilvae]|uniref:sensor histidine kinase n=1 Tax=Actinoplanes solisilvae TaxID=2486853 RepID=UPI000FD6BC1B|nr:histidine kinase [Actinoplanes solisilvae]